MKREYIPAIVLGALGLAQMAGDLSGLVAVKALAAATAASPAPKVFSAVRGFETYSTRFFLEWTTKDGTLQSVPITPQLTANFQGPYNRRNVYGAALAYGPVMPDALRGPVMRYALCGTGRLLTELELQTPGRTTPFRVRFEPREGSDIPVDLPLVLEAPCF
jgi:hypothetical protein